MTTAIQTDWRYSDDRMKLRQEVLSILLEKYGNELNEDGSPKHSPQSIYECAHDWVSQGNEISAGVVAFYKAYYTDYGRYRNV
jgi:hypothetical protein